MALELHPEGLAENVRLLTVDRPRIARAVVRRQRAVRETWWRGFFSGAITAAVVSLLAETVLLALMVRP